MRSLCNYCFPLVKKLFYWQISALKIRRNYLLSSDFFQRWSYESTLVKHATKKGKQTRKRTISSQTSTTCFVIVSCVHRSKYPQFKFRSVFCTKKNSTLEKSWVYTSVSKTHTEIKAKISSSLYALDDLSFTVLSRLLWLSSPHLALSLPSPIRCHQFLWASTSQSLSQGKNSMTVLRRENGKGAMNLLTLRSISRPQRE